MIDQAFEDGISWYLIQQEPKGKILWRTTLQSWRRDSKAILKEIAQWPT